MIRSRSQAHARSATPGLPAALQSGNIDRSRRDRPSSLATTPKGSLSHGGATKERSRPPPPGLGVRSCGPLDRSDALAQGSAMGTLRYRHRSRARGVARRPLCDALVASGARAVDGRKRSSLAMGPRIGCLRVRSGLANREAGGGRSPADWLPVSLVFAIDRLSVRLG